MLKRLLIIFTFIIATLGSAIAQVMPKADTVIASLQKIPAKYLTTVSDKADKYYKGITSKTEKTLERLARWENKIKTLLEKASPETAQRLFGEGQLTFSDVLSKYKEGKQIAEGERAKYDEYRDKLTSTIKYIEENKAEADKKIVQPLKEAKEKTDKLNEQLKNTEAVQQFIRERKKALMQQAVQYIGKSKYLQKINKESYYYVETLRNYKEIFSDPKKVEETAVKLLQKIPAFDEFLGKNSMLASLFGLPGDASSQGTASLAGLQTRTQINNLIQMQLASGGPNAQQQFQQNIQEAQAQLSELKDKILKAGGSNSDQDIPDFKPNTTRSKTFLQRLEYAANVQTQKATNFFPVTSDIGLSLGYKLNDKSVIGIGASYKLGWGRGWDHIKITHQGVGLRSYVDVNLKGSFWISGGYEQSYRPMTDQVASVLPRKGLWQKSGLLGLSKVVSVKSKFFKKTKASLLWDFLSYQQVPRGQAVVFRVGYNIK